MIFAFVGQKGGTGKSTLAICIATELSARGRRVLLVDADPQLTVITWHDVATERKHTTPTVIAMNGTLHEPSQLPQLAAGYDDVVIDTAGDLGKVQRSAMMVADLAILPCGPTAPDAWALSKSIETVQEAREYRPNLKAVLLINKIRAGTAAAKGARKALSSAGLPILAAELGLRQAYVDALADGQGVTAYAPKEEAAKEVRDLVSELREMEDKDDGEEGQADARGARAKTPTKPGRVRARPGGRQRSAAKR
jgi:chromosome partitioning protein